MIERQIVFEIYRLDNNGLSVRRIAEQLMLNRKTVKKYLENPFPKKVASKRISKLDPFKDEIARLLDIYPKASAVVIRQKLQNLGYDGGITILKDYLRTVRKGSERQAYIRFESPPGRQMQIDWGHFGSLVYENERRRLYAMAVIEAHSRMLYVEFTHSQKQEALHQCLLNAFLFFGGTPEELLVDNMLTAVIERQGPVIRFNDAFLDFLRLFKIVPKACNVRSPHEKGKVENSIKYLRHNFWPLRTFTNLEDVQVQVKNWLSTVANVRVHQSTGKRPLERLDQKALSPLPDILPDVRETAQLLVHKDFAVRFDANSYTVPPWTIGRQVIVKADLKRVSIFYRDKEIAVHPRSYCRKKRIELPSHREQVKKLHNKLWQDRQIALFISLGQEAVDYLQGLVKARQPIKKNIRRLLALKDEYGSQALIFAIEKASHYNAFAAEYIENILYQKMSPKRHHPKVKLKNKVFNRMWLVEPSLAQYDAYIIKKGKNND